jgi:phytoene dehydrogenase-like protein
VPVEKIVPGEGIELESGEQIRARIVVSNADPRRTLTMLGGDADEGWRAQAERVPMEGCTVKLNVHLRELPNFTARPGVNEPHHYGQINAPLTKDEWKTGFAAARRGELPEHLWCELYFQSAHDASIVPQGQHTMSVFAQYVPYKFARGSWDERREEVRALAMKSLSRFCSNIPDAVIDAHRRAHFPGRVPAAVYVVEQAFYADADAGRVPLRRGDAPRRQRDWHQWAQRGNGGAERPRQNLAAPRI